MLQALETAGEQCHRPVPLGAPTPTAAPAPSGLTPEMCVPRLKQSHPMNFSTEMFPELTEMCAEGHLAAAPQQRTAGHNPDLPPQGAASPTRRASRAGSGHAGERSRPTRGSACAVWRGFLRHSFKARRRHSTWRTQPRVSPSGTRVARGEEACRLFTPPNFVLKLFSFYHRYVVF